MTDSNLKIKNIDRLIFSFLVLFAATLNNSIFLNQIGFFSVYILIIIKAYYLKENPIKGNKLNQVFLILIVVFLLTAILSPYKEEALIRSIKKILLIPIVYSLIYFVDERAKAGKIIKTYLVAALITNIIYLLFSSYHYIYHLYSLEKRGPSPFQYVMTAGGLMSFTALFFFSYFLNEKVSQKIKALLFISFTVSIVSVIASYTRAAWLGTIFGLITIIIIKKKWKILISFLIILFSFIFLFNNESKVGLYKIENNKLNHILTLNTNGRANDILITNDNKKLVADYENGVILLKNNNTIFHRKFSVPITNVNMWNDSLFVAYTLDQRFFLLKFKNEAITVLDSFYTKGKTVDFKLFDNKFYVADEDSGLTIFNNPIRLRGNFIKYKGISKFAVIDSIIIIYNREKQSLLLKKLIDNKYFVNMDSIKFNSSIENIFRFNDQILLQTEKELIIYKIISNKFIKEQVTKISGCFKSVENDSLIYLISINGKLYLAENFDGKLKIKELYDFKKTITSFDVRDNNLVITSYYRNRITSVFDKYHITNFERFNIWKTGIKIFLSSPIYGVGDIDLQKVYQIFKDPHLKENFGHLHNNFVNWLVVYGLVGTILILYVFIRIFLFLIKFYRSNKNEEIISSFIIGTIASFVAFTFSGIGEYNFGDQEIMTVLWFLLGLNLALYKIVSEKK